MNEQKPPGIALRLLAVFCPSHLYEEIEGDLLEQFRKDIKRFGSAKAKRRFLWKSVKFFRPGILLRNDPSISFNEVHMFRNYFKVMMRNVSRRKGYSAIHVFGLTTGITFALLIGAFIQGEMGINQNLKDVERLYMLENKYTGAQEGMIWFSPAPLCKAAVEQYPTLFENYYRFWDRQVTVSKGDKHFRLQSMIGDSTFIDIFGFNVLFGNQRAALKDVNAIVISEQVAWQFFNRVDVIGQTLELTTELNGKKEFVVTAVIANPQKKSTVTDLNNMDAQIFIPLGNRSDFTLADASVWRADIISYIKLTPAASPAEANTALNKLMKANTPEIPGNERFIELSPLKDYYRTMNNAAIQKLIISLSGIVGFILVLAVCNFINISISNSFSRLKEIGIRKVVGGLKRQLLFQFLSESVLLALISGVFSIILYEVLRGYFAGIVGSSVPSVITFSLSACGLIFGGILLVGLLAGFYPAVYLSATKTIESLKGKFKSVKGTLQFSRVLIGIQFFIAIFIFIAAVVMSKQVAFFLDKDLGYDRSLILMVTSVPRMWSPEGFDKMESARSGFLASPRIKGVSLSWGSPSVSLMPTGDKIYRPGQSADDGLIVTLTGTDENFAAVYGLKLLEGKFLMDNGAAYQPFNIVLNESAAKTMSARLGDKVRLKFWDGIEFTIVGVTNDFNAESLHEPLKPVVFIHNRDFNAFRFFSFKLSPGSPSQSIAEVEAMWKKIFPDEPFVYFFADEKLAALYNTEYQLKRASEVATVLMFIIVLTGVLGLVSLSVSKRRKEIGIRKVLGASVFRILVLVSREYTMLIILSFAAGIPVTYFFASRWLEGYAYHIDLQWWMFALPAALVLGVTLMIICVQSLRTALSNPVNSLRYE